MLHCERSELRLHFTWTKVNKNAKNRCKHIEMECSLIFLSLLGMRFQPLLPQGPRNVRISDKSTVQQQLSSKVRNQVD